MNYEAIVKKIHEKPVKIAMVLAGGGAEVIGELMRYGGASQTILDVQVPYSQEAFVQYLGGKPDKFCSEEAACQLASAAYQRAISLCKDNVPLMGVGATCSLAKNHEREGRKHKIFVAVQKADELVCHTFEPDLSRTEEEELTAKLILWQIATELDVPEVDNISISAKDFRQTNRYFGSDKDQNLFHGKTNLIAYPDFEGDPRFRIIFPGSFNPIHAGHLQMALTATTGAVKIPDEVRRQPFTGAKVNFEISIKNVDKPMLHYGSLENRLIDFERHKKDNPWLGHMFFTNAPKFTDKALLFPKCTFVVGFDTFKRIGDPKYYSSEAEMYKAFALFKEQEIVWNVYHRVKEDGTMSTEKDIELLPEALWSGHCCTYDVPIPQLSSRDLRKQLDK